MLRQDNQKNQLNNPENHRSGFSSLAFNASFFYRLLAGSVVLLLVFLFPLQWFTNLTANVSVSRAFFSPAAGQDPNVTTVGTGPTNLTITYAVSSDGTADLEIVSADGSIVRHLTVGQQVKSGAHALTWNGLDENGLVVPDGRYNVNLHFKGLFKETTASANVTVDSATPVLKLTNLDDGAKVGDPELAIHGLTKPGAVVHFSDDQTNQAVADTNGLFTISRKLKHGEQNLIFMATDRAGNVTSVNRKVILFDGAPTVKIEQPKDGLYTNQRSLTIIGSADPGAHLLLNGHDVVLDDKGAFKTDYILDEGPNILKLQASDPVNHTGTLEETITLDTKAPVVTLENLADGSVVTDANLHVNGTTKIGTQLTINDQAVTVDAHGAFDTIVHLQQGQNQVNFVATDKAGNTSTLHRNVSLQSPGTGPAISINPNIGRIGGGLVALTILWILFGGLFGSISLRLSADRNLIYPMRPGEGRNLLLRYQLSRGARTTIRIVNEKGQTMTTLVGNSYRGKGEHFLIWDGRTATGRPLPEGSYMVQATARAISGSATSGLNVVVSPPEQENDDLANLETLLKGRARQD